MNIRSFLLCGWWMMAAQAYSQSACHALAKGSAIEMTMVEGTFLLPGSKVSDVTAKWGNPDEKIGNIFIYRQQGCLVYTNPDHSQIIAMVGSWFPGYGGFSQRIFGLSLGSTYPKCISLLGQPKWRKPLVENIEEAFWTCGPYEIRCEIWTQNDYDPDIGGNIYAETIKRIQVQKPWKP